MAIGVVTQDTALLHRSVGDNLRYGRRGASADEIARAMRLASADAFIDGLRDSRGRDGLNAMVGERGVKLSGGQRQRIAIARVLLKNAPILVLDEATSALDSEVEAAIQESLNDLMAGKTVIAIAHRLSRLRRWTGWSSWIKAGSSKREATRSLSREMGSMRRCGSGSLAGSWPKSGGVDARRPLSARVCRESMTIHGSLAALQPTIR